jgi:hypothetical protein
MSAVRSEFPLPATRSAASPYGARPRLDRLIDPLVDIPHHLRSALRAWLDQRAQRRRADAERTMLEDLDPRVLIDIGAPDELIGQAQARRQRETARWMQAYTGR